jgi:SulP family sulfate permease
MVDPKAILHHFRVSRFDAAIVFATAFAAFAVSVEFCVLIGVFLSFVLAVPRTGQMLLTEFVVTPEGVIHERLAGDVVCGRILIFGIEGEMFFGAGTSLERHFAEIESRLTADSKVVVLRMKRARNPDAVTLALLEGFVTRLQERGVRVVLCGVRSDVLGVLERSGVIGRFRKEEIYTEQAVRQTSTQLAVRYASTLVPDPCPTCPKFGEGSLHEAV